MSNLLMTVIGFLVIFIATALGSAVVWFFKKDISEKVNTVFLGFASGINDRGVCMVVAYSLHGRCG